ncbi:3-deoxy-D-manno-octulosonic acid kinase [Idiomarina loihiensis]|jgi:3-deoxy-D-manno-octulosonic-acid transferase|nr:MULTISPECIES: 3-deoxy-D-manno-octulosonic acid kinase [Idiomarina]MAA62674.1 3-deoxy-D-manno-octulosonic acid kinase [Idiomarina sp.]MRJ44747.1 3-deoxy-D-manno-octulosonic acid kinase [Idiomarina loihiensis]PHQ92053.1 MAG: 3-deoxy-D-manno-octulosonic acid kinase [Idiomarina sp.]UTW34319.1 3-deoxy-D-manno-octulosonic acid kinase [Idiomarina loihiensis]HAS23007.1 3-deoxy-D-manno-octulosonic acid kinase [Idiomarina loihiensis]|tara:strand:+ start:15570 stop:17555 length:1986 start_codon:yes stop_codon:yes gene_type:complete
MQLWIYGVLIRLVTPAVFVWLWLRGGKDSRYRQNWSERLALGSVDKKQHGCLVIHSVSVGETLAAKRLIEQLLRQEPGQKILITCMTPTARELIQQHFGDTVSCRYWPIDTPGAAKRFVRKFKPKAVWVMETELWPQMLNQFSKANIPVALLNARLSARSAAGYRRFHWLMKKVWKQLTLVSVQNKETARRMKVLGVPDSVLFVDGNLKYDIELSVTDIEKALLWRQSCASRHVWLASSSHPGEHELLLEAHKLIQQDLSNSCLIIAPRHPEQFEVVAKMIRESGLKLARRSESNAIPEDCDVFLADSMGEMMLWGQLASASFVGGSIIERGGHNPLEVIAAGSNVMSGRHVFNFPQVYGELAKAGAVQWVNNAGEIKQAVELMQQTAVMKAQHEAAKSVLQTHQGATLRVLKRALEYTLTGSGMIKTEQSPQGLIRYDSDIFETIEDKHFTAQYWQQQKSIAGNSTGRATVWFIQQGDLGLLLRHYYRGGLVGKINKDRFLREPAEKSRAIHEFDLLLKLREIGLPVPRPVAARMEKTAVFSYKADILVEVIPGAVDVFRLLREKKLSAELWQKLGSVIKELHDTGVYHSDLNCHNLMLDDKDKAWIVDFDKCDFRENGDWKEANIQRLLRSLRKEKEKNETFYWKESRDWPELLTGYRR